MAENLDQNMPRPPSDFVQVAIRIPADWQARADALIAHISHPGQNSTRTDVFRTALARGIEALEAEARTADPMESGDRDKLRAVLFAVKGSPDGRNERAIRGALWPKEGAGGGGGIRLADEKHLERWLGSLVRGKYLSLTDGVYRLTPKGTDRVK